MSYYEAEAYAKWRGGRLPTEAEWEYAARGTSGWIFPWGNTFDKSKANTKEGGPGKTTAVDAYPTGRSWVGAYDMAGNVFQWVSDWYSETYYSSSLVHDPTGPTTGQLRVLRGGSWNYDQTSARSTFRGNPIPDLRLNRVGVRVMAPAAPN